MTYLEEQIEHEVRLTRTETFIIFACGLLVGGIFCTAWTFYVSTLRIRSTIEVMQHEIDQQQQVIDSFRHREGPRSTLL